MMARQGRNLTQSNHCRVFGWCRSWSLPLFPFPPDYFRFLLPSCIRECFPSVVVCVPPLVARLNLLPRASWVSMGPFSWCAVFACFVPKASEVFARLVRMGQGRIRVKVISPEWWSVFVLCFGLDAVQSSILPCCADSQMRNTVRTSPCST